MSPNPNIRYQKGALQLALLVGSAVGITVLLGTFLIMPKQPTELQTEPSVEYGRQLIEDIRKDDVIEIFG